MAKVLRACTLSVLLAAVGCVNDPLPFSPLTAQQQERQLAGEIPPSAPLPLPTTMASQYAPFAPPRTPGQTQPGTGPNYSEAPVVKKTLQELIQQSVINSHIVKVAGYDPAIAETRIIEAQAHFDPTFFSNTQYDRHDIPTGGEEITLPQNPFATPPPIFYTTKTRTMQEQVGIRQQLESGGQAEFRWEGTLTDQNPQTTIQNPLYTSELILEITQPLLRDFGAEVNRARIVLERNNTKVSVLDYRLALEKNTWTIEETYWQLEQARRDVEAYEQLLASTQESARILGTRYTQDATREGISQTLTALNQRQGLLVRAKAHMADLSDLLKSLVNDPDLPVSSELLIMPESAPTLDHIDFDVDDQVRTAMDSRADLAEAQLKIDNASEILKVAQNNLLPQLNFVGRFSYIGGDVDITSAIDNEWDFDHVNYRAGLQLEVPIGNREASAIYQRSILQREQAIETYRQTISDGMKEVKTAIRDVETSWQEIVDTRRAVFAAEDALAANQAREESNQILTPEFLQLKLDRQSDLANARIAYDSAVANYNVALATLERTKGTLLRYDNIVLQEDRWPYGKSVRVK
ncbi:MAG TPA: TolC family protein [Tepidisphaeraceae bacterium]|jgi:outer membrane protein TolC